MLPISEIILEITGQCHLHCSYCTNTEQRNNHAPVNDILKAIEEISQLQIPSVRFTGGEPLLHPELRLFLEHARKHNLYITLNTSAATISPKELRFLTKNVDCALVSLQGYNQVSNAQYTHSQQLFVEKIKNIFALKAYLPALRLGTVLTPSFLETLPEFTKLVQKIRPLSWGLFRPIYSGTEKFLGQKFFKDLILKVNILNKNNIPAQIANALPMCVAGNFNIIHPALLGSRFDDGHQRLVRDARGFFKPSYFINENLGTTITEAWAHPIIQILNSTTQLPSICQQCPFLHTCLGGCRAMAYKEHKSYAVVDPLFNKTAAKKAQKTFTP